MLTIAESKGFQKLDSRNFGSFFKKLSAVSLGITITTSSHCFASDESPTSIIIIICNCYNYYYYYCYYYTYYYCYYCSPAIRPEEQ